MKSKLLKSIGIAILCLAVILGNVLAFSLGSTDGVWGRIDSAPASGSAVDATCDAWGRATNSNYTIHDVLGVVYNTAYGPGGESERYVRNSTSCTGTIIGDGTFSSYTRYGTVNWGGLGSHTSSCGTTSTLLISEYVWDEYWGFTDHFGVEIYNNTGAAIDLAANNFSLLFFTTDKDLVQVNLTGTINNGGVYVVVNSAAAGDTSAENQTIANNNDYRTVVLIQNYSPQVINAISTSYPETVQAYSTSDENMVRYGEVSGGCPSTPAGFADQSGFGFQGIEDRAFEPAEGQLFPVGRFCHYNNPINATNDFEQVPLDLTINNIGCPPGQTLEPPTSDDLTFSYLVSLDETSNGTSPCVYGPSSPAWPGGAANPYVTGDTGPNRNGCADRVLFSALGGGGTQEFTCRIDSQHTQDYTVSILGFVPTTAGAACPDTPTGTIQFNQIYTSETAKNCFCVYAAYTRGQITPVVLLNLSAVSVENGVLISWETVTETNNFGFNIMRAESTDGEQTQVNPEMIMSQIAPGDMFGASYEYLDSTAAEGVTYYYWLVDVPLDSADLPGIHGPISVTR
ncbi:MAG: choice-of-anchor K domain-containing protein [Anaerolineaceae bacterium]|nr:choice-of-anchor K domain-containing protein [Anaerolineaceae bacterium]